MYCTECGHGIDGTLKFCPECGTKIGDKTFKVAPVELIQSLITKHFSVIAGYGSAPDDRVIVHSAIVNLFNDFSRQMFGSDCFENFDKSTGDADCDFPIEFTDEHIELVVEALIQSDELNDLIKPIVAGFLFWFVYFTFSDLRINPTIAHKIKLLTLDDKLSDSNLRWFSNTEVFGFIKDFYKNIFPGGKNEFLSAMQSIVSSVKPGPLGTIPGHSGFDNNKDRKTEWENLYTIYNSADISLSIKSVLETQNWLEEYKLYFESNFTTFLDQEFVALIQCQESVIGNKSPISGKDQILFFSTQGICEVYAKKKHRRNSQPLFYTLSEVAEISIGTEEHESFSGFSSSVSTFMVFTIFTTSNKIYTKHIYLGDTESKLNASRPQMMERLQNISKFFTIVEGDVIQSSSGFSISPAIGFWQGID